MRYVIGYRAAITSFAKAKSTRLLLGSWLTCVLLGACGQGGTTKSPASSDHSIPLPTVNAKSTVPMTDFVLPYDDAAAGITQVGALLNHTPAGKYGSLKVGADGHFMLGASRERFLGVNITAGSTMTSQANAKKVAARLAKFGVNLVRFHHMDNHFGAPSIINYGAGDSRSLDTSNLDKVDYLASQLKRQGIYLDINLLNSRQFFAADGLPPEISQLSWKESQVLGYVDARFRTLEKDYARQLLSHVNPYTQLSYAQDPAVAFVEINNENGIFQQFYSGALDKWPPAFRLQLVAKWNTWLQRKYANTAELMAAWGARTEPLGSEQLLNNSFSKGIDHWNLEQRGGAVATVQSSSFEGRAGLKVAVTKAGSSGWDIQLNQRNQSVSKGQLYTLGFWAKADSHLGLTVALGQNYEPWGNLETRSYSLNSGWAYFETSFIAASSDSNLRINFNGFGNQLSAVYLADVSFRAGGAIGQLPAGQALESNTLEANFRSQGYTAKRNQDWAEFLRSLETSYWLDMKNFIKKDLKFAGLVTGTALMNSFPSAQQQMDFVDAHAYWQHPEFPGADWDGVNWKIDNISMVNSASNVLSALSKQRIRGKPFTVSEYQHPSPNFYSAEGPLLAAAYGALQDWDGIMFFAYDANANDNWGAGFFSDFFSMNAHPTKMANMLIAANIFRRGDVAAARNLVALNWTPDTELSVLANKGAVWNVANGSHVNVPNDLPLANRVALDVSPQPHGLAAAPVASPTARITSDTNELVWNRSLQDKGVVTIDTDKTKSVVGFIAGRRFDLGNVSISVAPTGLDWATVSLSLQQGSFAQPEAAAKILMVLTGKVENTRMGWTDASFTSVSNHWGAAPTRIEVVPATIDLPFSSAKTNAWSLDETGQRKSPVKVLDNQGKARLVLDGTAATLWYEVNHSD